MLSDRKKVILKAIVDEYVQSATPVGSRAITDRLNLGLSPATIRNEMADLEAMGYLASPHASAGRVPTHAGYRIYVNELMNANYHLSALETQEYDSALRLRIQELDRLFGDAGRLLSQLTRYAALTVVPHFDSELLRRIEIIPCDVCSYIIVVVTVSGIVRNKLCRTRAFIPQDDVTTLINALNTHLSGLAPASITLAHIAGVEDAVTEQSRELYAAVMTFLKEVAQSTASTDVRLGGASNLLSFPEYRDVEKAKLILDFLSSPGDSSWLSIPSADTDVAVSIGTENLPEPLRDTSILVAGFPIAGNRKGFVGIVGPTRMDYERMTARLRYFAEGLGNLLKDVMLDPDSDSDTGRT